MGLWSHKWRVIDGDRLIAGKQDVYGRWEDGRKGV